MSRFTPADLFELRDAVAEALAVEEPLEVIVKRRRPRVPSHRLLA